MINPLGFLLPQRLSKRERQIMEVLYARGRGTVGEVLAAMADPPGYSAVRRFLAILEEKGQVRHEKEGRGYVYVPVQPLSQVSKSALVQVVEAFFGGSVEAAVGTLLSERETMPTDAELERLEALIKQARSTDKPRSDEPQTGEAE